MHTNIADEEKNMGYNVIVTTATAIVETERAKRVTPKKDDEIIGKLSPKPKFVHGDDS